MRLADWRPGMGGLGGDGSFGRALNYVQRARRGQLERSNLYISRRQAEKTLPHACRANSPAIGAKQAARNQERYRTAGRVLPRSPRGEWTCVLDPSGDDCKARFRQSEIAPCTKKYPAGRRGIFERRIRPWLRPSLPFSRRRGLRVQPCQQATCCLRPDRYPGS